MNRTRLIAGATPLALGLLACGGDEPSLVERVATYEELHNRHDIDGSMDLFAPDAVFEAVGLGTLDGVDAIRSIHEYDRAIDAQVRFDGCRADDGVVTCSAREANRWVATAGLDDVTYPTSVFTFDDEGRITKVVATMSPESGAAIGGVLERFVPWIHQERPDGAAQLFDAGGLFVYGEANGELVVDLLAEWRAATGS